jgi:hypothetical protein
MGLKGEFLRGVSNTQSQVLGISFYERMLRRKQRRI